MLSMRPADPVRERSALEQVRRWARRSWSHAAKDGPAGLIIDVSGMPDLFDGEEHLRVDIEARLERVDRNAQFGLGHASSLVSGCKGVAARLLVLAAERTQGVILMRKMALVFQAQVLERPFFDRPGCQAGGVEPDQDIALFPDIRRDPIDILAKHHIEFPSRGVILEPGDLRAR